MFRPIPVLILAGGLCVAWSTPVHADQQQPAQQPTQQQPGRQQQAGRQQTSQHQPMQQQATHQQPSQQQQGRQQPSQQQRPHQQPSQQQEGRQQPSQQQRPHQQPSQQQPARQQQPHRSPSQQPVNQAPDQPTQPHQPHRYPARLAETDYTVVAQTGNRSHTFPRGQESLALQLIAFLNSHANYLSSAYSGLVITHDGQGGTVVTYTINRPIPLKHKRTREEAEASRRNLEQRYGVVCTVEPASSKPDRSSATAKINQLEHVLKEAEQLLHELRS